MNLTTIDGREAGTKKCASHHEWFPSESANRPFDEFFKVASYASGLDVRCKRCTAKKNAARATGFNNPDIEAKKQAKILYPEIFEKVSWTGGNFNKKAWLGAGGTQGQIDNIRAQSVAGGKPTPPAPKVFGFDIAKPTKFGSRPGTRGARISGQNPTEKGRQNELTMNELLAQRNPALRLEDVAQDKLQRGYDTALWEGDKMVAAIDSSTDKVLQEHEYQAMVRLAEQGIPFFIFLADSQKMYPVTPDTPWQINSRKV